MHSKKTSVARVGFMLFSMLFLTSILFSLSCGGGGGGGWGWGTWLVIAIISGGIGWFIGNGSPSAFFLGFFLGPIGWVIAYYNRK